MFKLADRFNTSKCFQISTCKDISFIIFSYIFSCFYSRFFLSTKTSTTTNDSVKFFSLMVISEVTSEQKKPSESNLKSTKKAKDEVKSKMQLPTTTASTASVSQPQVVTSTGSGKLRKSICNTQCYMMFILRHLIFGNFDDFEQFLS